MSLQEVNREKYINLLRDAITDVLYDIKITANNKKIYPKNIARGRIWPNRALSMIGIARMNNIKVLLEDVIKNNIAGDFLEAGVWRGGSCIFAKGILNAWGQSQRQVILADSFEGLPHPKPKKYPVDAGDKHHQHKYLAVSDKQVRENFIRFNLLDERVKFIKGFFSESFKRPLPFDKLAILRLDGDMYESTIETLEALYDKVSPGGYIIIDDYALKGAHKAVDNFREKRKINDAINRIDWTGIWWKKSQ